MTEMVNSEVQAGHETDLIAPARSLNLFRLCLNHEQYNWVADTGEFIAITLKGADRDKRVKFCVEQFVGSNDAPLPEFGDLARQVNLSPSRLRHLFLKCLDVSPARLVKTLRIIRARKLLAETFLTVKEVMFRVGLNDPSHFARDYRWVFGESPSATQRRQSRGAI